MIMIVYGYTQARKISMVNTNRSDWVTLPSCENPIYSSPKESTKDLSVLIFI